MYLNIFLLSQIFLYSRMQDEKNLIEVISQDSVLW